jgi:hypothetical protein
MWETNERGNPSSFPRIETKPGSKIKIIQQYPKANYRNLIEMVVVFIFFFSF